MYSEIKKIALIGPESTGKTTLCRQLAMHFGTQWVPEFARDYISGLNREYTLDDIVRCAREQLRLESELIKTAKRFLFCDTEMIIAKVWCEDVFEIIPGELQVMVSAQKYDLCLLTLPDLPFLQDDVRENPHRREYFFEWYKRELEEAGYNYAVIGGTGETRLSNAIDVIRQHFPDL